MISSNAGELIDTLDMLTFEAVLDVNQEVEEVILFLNDKILDRKIAPPFIFNFSPDEYMEYTIKMSALLVDGSTVPSSNEVQFLRVKPDIAQDVKIQAYPGESFTLFADRAIDHNLYTRWACGPYDNAFYKLEFDEIKNVSGMTIIWETAYAKSYRIELSLDGENWFTVYEESNGNGGIDNIEFESSQAKFVKFQGIERGTEWGYSIWEILIH